MPATDFRFAKTLATPTETAWTHVYHAGNLYAVLSLAKDTLKEDETIGGIGKEFLNNLEAEFFALEEKTLPSMKEALQNVLSELPEDVRISLCLAFCKETALYVFGIGGATTLLKRNDHIGTVLGSSDEEKTTRTVHGASGFLKPNDTILLTTETFARRITLAQITKACEGDTPEAISDTLSQMLEEVSDGDAGVLILIYRPAMTDSLDEVPAAVGAAEAVRDEPIPDNSLVSSQNESLLPQHEPTLAVEPSLTHNYEHLGHAAKSNTTPLEILRQKLTSTISTLRALPIMRLIIIGSAIIIFLILIVAISLTTKKREASATSALFTKAYAEATKDYELGKDLKDLNKALAQDDFQKAKKIITDNKSRFKSDTSEGKKLTELEQKVDAQLQGAAAVHTVEATAVEDSADGLLAAEKTQSGAIAASNDDGTRYTMTKAEVFKGAASIIKGGSDWSSPVGLAAYNGNVYILDQKNGIIKYAAGAGGYGKQSYFKDNSPDLSKAQAVAIDGSVWILMNDSILKYTRGTKDAFGVLGLDKPFSSPTKIVTSADMTNLYVLDQGNSRIVKIKKDGTFQSQYAATVLATAKDFTINEKDGMAYVLAGGKIFKISLK